MRKRFAILFGFLCLGLLDTVLSYGMPINYEYTGFSVLWHWYLIGVLVFTRDKPLLLRFLIGSIAGLAYGMLFGSSLFTYWIFYTLSAVLIGFAEPWMNTINKQFIVYLAFVLVFDLITFYLMNIGSTGISLWTWLYRMELISVFASAFSIVCVMFMDNVMVRFFLIQRHLERKQERKMMRSLHTDRLREYS